MSEDDKAVFKQARPYIVGLVALAFSLRSGSGFSFHVGSSDCAFAQPFSAAEKFVKHFESVNGIDS